MVFYPLYLLTEISLILIDLSELVGSAIAINLLSADRVPLWAGVLLTSSDVVIVLAFFWQYPPSTASRAVHLFECMIGLIVIAIIVVLIILLSRFSPDWGRAFLDFLPSSGVVADGGLYNSVAIVGATIAPSALYLGSKVAVVQRGRIETEEETDKIGNALNQELRRVPEMVKMHLKHASLDLGLSLLLVALVVNALVLILAAAATSATGDTSLRNGDLFAAYDLIKAHLGGAPATLFAVALLASGQAASLVVTLSGQIVSEGFFNWSIRPWMRRVATRAISIAPAVAVAAAVGRAGITELLLVTQVANSLTLPFIIAPLLLFTSSPQIMSVSFDGAHGVKSANTAWTRFRRMLRRPFRTAADSTTARNFATSALLDVLSWALLLLLMICNIFALTNLDADED